uniref:Uncharacterized protein n=1 Tax=Fervidicoccus fontis TaxID=683846 RepID=A0A7J3ZNT1_9CREN
MTRGLVSLARESDYKNALYAYLLAILMFAILDAFFIPAKVAFVSAFLVGGALFSWWYFKALRRKQRLAYAVIGFFGAGLIAGVLTVVLAVLLRTLVLLIVIGTVLLLAYAVYKLAASGGLRI